MVLSWLKRASEKLVDPHRESRVRALSKTLTDALTRDRDRFELQAAVAGQSHSIDDLVVAAEQCYMGFVERGLADGTLSDKERSTLAWIAKRLFIEDERAKFLRYDVRRQIFLRQWIQHLRAGEVDVPVLQQLQRQAKSLGVEPAAFLEPPISQQVLVAIQDSFSMLHHSFRSSNPRWMTFGAMAELVGVSKPTLLVTLAPAATSIVSEALANATADGDVSGDELSHIRFLMEALPFDPQRRSAVEATIARVNLLRDIERGRLPSLSVHHIGLRAGEIVHAQAAARYYKPRRRQGRVEYESFDGLLLITDFRLLFAGGYSFELQHRRVQGLRLRREGFELNCTSRGAGIYSLQDPQLVLAILQSAVQRANQTLVSEYDPTAARHIPRDVRQRVWQRYGGRCAECGAESYLEFDHIVPVARGGSNSDANVQLLCRGCNGKKSDRI